tara:strand:- start:2343 stop:3194 length:852 start_codon:yes stop_codon:yes gene_type:complete
MLKTVSSVANAIGALNYKGTWNASTNTPALASGVGTQGDYYVVSVAGATDLNGITNWGIGDWATFNGSVWQRVEGGADGNFVNLSASGTLGVGGNVTVGDYASNDIRLSETRTNKAIFAISTDGATNANGTTISYSWANGGQGPLKFSSSGGEVARFLPFGGLTFNGDTAQANALDDYEEGTWTPGYTSWLADPTVATAAKYTKIGRLVNVSVYLTGGTTQAGAQITGLPFTCGTESSMISTNGSNSSLVFYGTVLGGSTVIGSLSAETLTGTYYAVTATYMV